MTTTTALVALGVALVVYAVILLAALAFVHACEKRGKDPDVTWRPGGEREQDRCP